MRTAKKRARAFDPIALGRVASLRPVAATFAPHSARHACTVVARNRGWEERP